MSSDQLDPATTHSLVRRSRSGTIRVIVAEHQFREHAAYGHLDLVHDGGAP